MPRTQVVSWYVLLHVQHASLTATHSRILLMDVSDQHDEQQRLAGSYLHADLCGFVAENDEEVMTYL